MWSQSLFPYNTRIHICPSIEANEERFLSENPSSAQSANNVAGNHGNQCLVMEQKEVPGEEGDIIKKDEACGMDVPTNHAGRCV